MNRRPSAGHSTTNSVDHWSGGFSQWGQSLRPYPKGPTFPWYRGHPGGLSRVPGTRKGSFHPQRSGSQTLGLQCAPPTPPSFCHILLFIFISNYSSAVIMLRLLLAVLEIKFLPQDCDSIRSLGGQDRGPYTRNRVYILYTLLIINQ